MSLSFLLSGWGSNHFGPRPVTFVLAAIAGSWSVFYLGLTRSARAADADEPGSETVSPPVERSTGT
jgi:hypothetical protein